MPISHLEHFLIVTDDVEATTRWYVEVLGFRVGDTPDFGVPVNWLYLGEQDVIHVAKAKEPAEKVAGVPAPGGPDDITRGGRPIHHVAFRASGLAEMRDHLTARGVEFVEQQLSRQNLYQVFLRDPNGITVELNFRAEEGADMDAPALVLNTGK